MTRDESESARGQKLTAREIESLPLDEITKELDRRGVAYKAPPRLMASINAFREKEAKAFPRELTDGDRQEIARIEKTPIELIRAELDKLGVNHRAGLEALRWLIRAGTKPSFWGRETRPLLHLAATIALLILGGVWFWQACTFCGPDDADETGEVHADVMGLHKKAHPHAKRLNDGYLRDSYLHDSRLGDSLTPDFSAPVFNAPVLGLEVVEPGNDVDGAVFSAPAYKQAGDPAAASGCDAVARVSLDFGLPVTAPPDCASK